MVPPFLVALVILPFVIAHGNFWPWHPSTIDLQVYVYGVKDMLAGKDIFATTTPFWKLYFIYPPIAAPQHRLLDPNEAGRPDQLPHQVRTERHRIHQHRCNRRVNEVQLPERRGGGEDILAG